MNCRSYTTRLNKSVIRVLPFYHTSRLSSGKRPPELHSSVLKSGDRVAFSSPSWMKKLAHFLSIDLKFSHAYLTPHVVLNATGLGAPYLNYYYHPGITIGLAAIAVLYPSLFLLPPRITHLSFNDKKSAFNIQTAFCQQKLEMPFSSDCIFVSDKRSLYVGGHRYKFSIGEFNSKNMSILKRHLKAGKNKEGKNNSYSRLDLLWKELSSIAYMIIIIMSITTITLHYLLFGYTDIMFSIINMLAYFDEEGVHRKWDRLKY